MKSTYLLIIIEINFQLVEETQKKLSELDEIVQSKSYDKRYTVNKIEQAYQSITDLNKNSKDFINQYRYKEKEIQDSFVRNTQALDNIIKEVEKLVEGSKKYK